MDQRRLYLLLSNIQQKAEKVRLVCSKTASSMISEVLVIPLAGVTFLRRHKIIDICLKSKNSITRQT